MEVKKPTTFEQQLIVIKDKGFVINDERQCLDLLHRVNYYALSAYLLPFKLGKNEYVKGVDFEIIERIYEFDKKIRSLIFSLIEDIELFLRTQISYYHAHKYGPLGYLDNENYSSRHRHDVFLTKIEKECIEANSKTLVVKHHKEEYDGNFPIWVMIEYFTMGMLSHFYADLETSDKKYLSRELFDTAPGYLDSWLK